MKVPVKVKKAPKLVVEPLPRKKLEHSSNFTFIFLKPMESTTEIGQFEIKKAIRQRWFDLILHEFDEQIRRNPGSEIILVSRHKLVKTTSHVNSPKIQALIGYAITKGYLKFQSAFEKDRTKVFHLSYKDRPMIDTNF